MATKEEIAELATKEEVAEVKKEVRSLREECLTKKEFEDWQKDFWQRVAGVFGKLCNKDEVRDIVQEELVDVKERIADLQDVVASMRLELDTEHEFRQTRIGSNTKRIEKIEAKVFNSLNKGSPM